jgi:septal ring factor EnvC (AmiA/AmiB activator)
MENQLEIDEIRFKLGSQQQYVDELQRQIIELQRSYAELLVRNNELNKACAELQIQKFKASRSHLLKGLIASIFRKGLWS